MVSVFASCRFLTCTQFPTGSLAVATRTWCPLALTGPTSDELPCRINERYGDCYTNNGQTTLRLIISSVLYGTGGKQHATGFCHPARPAYRTAETRTVNRDAGVGVHLPVQF